MSAKPNCNELGKQVRSRKIEGTKPDQAKLTRIETEKMFKIFANLSNDMMHLCDQGGNIIYANPATQRLLGYSISAIVNTQFIKLAHPDNQQTIRDNFKLLMAKGKPTATREIRLRRHDGAYIDVLVDGLVMDFVGKVKYVGYILRNKTILKQSAQALLKTNQQLQQEIVERKVIEAKLLESRQELQRKASYLEETNIALNVLLKKREKDKVTLEEHVGANIKEFVLPSLEKVMCSNLSASQKTLIKFALLNIKEVTSNFSFKMSSKYFSLSPTEIKVANFIKHGTNTKQIADVLNISVHTVKNHRHKIRKKVGIKNKKINLSTYLSSCV